MTTPTKKDQITEGLEKLIYQWRDSPNVQGLLKSYLTSVQELEDTFFDLLTKRGIFEAEGEQLNVIGTRVGEGRLGREDEDYRYAILRRIAINNSDGTIPKILEILKSITTTEVASIFEHDSGFIHAYVDKNPSHSLASILEEITSAGVNARLLFDNSGDSFIGARVIPEEFIFTLDNGDLLEFEEGSETYLYEVDGTEIVTFGDRSYLPHTVDSVTINPLARVIDNTDYFIEEGLLRLENSDLIQLDDDSYLIYEIVEEL